VAPTDPVTNFRIFQVADTPDAVVVLGVEAAAQTAAWCFWSVELWMASERLTVSASVEITLEDGNTDEGSHFVTAMMRVAIAARASLPL
jgi:hypothetical protein